MKHSLYILAVCLTLVFIGCDSTASSDPDPIPQNDSLLTSFWPDSIAGTLTGYINGKGFGDDYKRIKVFVGDTACSVQHNVSDQQIRFYVNSNAMSGKLTVFIDSVPHSFTKPLIVLPTLSEISKYIAAPGDTIYIRGSNLGHSDATTKIKFGNTPAHPIFISHQFIRVIVPQITGPCFVSISVLGVTRSFTMPFSTPGTYYSQATIDLKQLNILSAYDSSTVDTALNFHANIDASSPSEVQQSGDTIKINRKIGGYTRYSKSMDWFDFQNSSVLVILNRASSKITSLVVFDSTYHWEQWHSNNSEASHSESVYTKWKDIPYTQNAIGDIIVDITGSALNLHLEQCRFVNTPHSMKSIGPARCTNKTTLKFTLSN